MGQNFPFAHDAHWQVHGAAAMPVAQSFFDAGWRSHDGRVACHGISLPRPNVALAGTSAECILNGLFKSKTGAEHLAFFEHMISVTSLACMHFTKDGAASNVRLTQAKFMELHNRYPHLAVPARLRVALKSSHQRLASEGFHGFGHEDVLGEQIVLHGHKLLSFVAVLAIVCELATAILQGCPAQFTIAAIF